MKLVLHFPPKNKILIYAQLILVMFVFFLRDFLHFPSFVTYITDLVLVLILLQSFQRIKRCSRKYTKTQWHIFLFICIALVLGVIFNLVNPLHVMWGIRNNLRFFLFFFICVSLLDEVDVEKLNNFLKAYFLLTVVFCTFQYFVLGLVNDDLGGFFGIGKGCNAYINVLICFISALVISEYFTKKRSFTYMSVFLILCIYIATLAELKIFYVELVCMILISILFNKPSLKTIVILFFGVVSVFLAFNLLLKYNPDSLSFFLDSNARRYYLAGEGYTNSGDLNRFTAIQNIYQKFFSENPFQSIFGFGIGSCDTSSFSFLQSEFFNRYEYLHYRWFTHAWVFLEQGFIGIILLVSFFISNLTFSLKNKKKLKNYSLLSILFVFCCLVGIIYNCSLELEAGYLIAFMCSIPFILIKNGEIK